MDTKECTECFSEIPFKAKKCRYCMEWQEELSSSKKEVSIEGHKSTVKPFQQSIINKLPFHKLVSVIVLTIICFVIIQLSWIKLKEDQIYLLSIFTFTIQMMISWYGIIWVHNLISENYASFMLVSDMSREEAIKSFEKYYKLIFHKRNSIITGIVAGLVASIGDGIFVGTPFVSTEAKIIFGLFEFLIMFFAGAAIYSMAIFAFYIRQLELASNEQFKNRDIVSLVNNIGQLHLKTAVLAIVPLFLGVIAKFIGTWSWDILNIMWYSSFAIIIIIYIYWPMMHIHKLMQDNIEGQLKIVQGKIVLLLGDINSNPTSRNLNQLYQLRDLEKTILAQNTWPFEMKSISAAFIAIIFPILLIIIDKIWKI